MPGIKFAAGASAAAVIAAAVLTVIPAPPAVSAQTRTEARPAKARPVPTTRADWTSDKVVMSTSDVDCPRTRRKLWVEGEGWMVRRVAVCR